ncbi:glycosyltransferase family 4 protein [Nocardia sp. NBC_01730]|uniref:glycosyltransferase family 4 protein n=1 Tax=Nocardia sp. NBC_01730 TaxID=2975998 RepID=UPI002E13AAC9|nr:glycosyltransferase family 4 protein [Nocardia sp. NBC_01730]
MRKENEPEHEFSPGVLVDSLATRALSSPSLSTRRLRVVVHDYLGHPHQLELSRELARRGHYVLHLYCNSCSVPRGRAVRLPDDPLDLTVRGMPGPRPGAHSWRRRTAELGYARRVAAAIKEFRGEIVVSGNAPPQVQLELRRRTRRKSRFVSWVQDMVNVPITAQVGATPFLGSSRGLQLRIDRALERCALALSRDVITIAPNFVRRLRDIGIPQDRIELIPNWGPTELLHAQPRPWPPIQDLADQKIILYAGTLDGRHGSHLLAALAEACHRSSKGVVVVTSEGTAADELKARSSHRLRVCGFQPYEQVPDMLAAADLLIVSVSPEAAEMSVPSKVLSYLCAGRAVFAAVPSDSPVADLIRDSGAGVVTPPEDPRRCAETALALLDDPDRLAAMGRAGRLYAEKHFDLDRITRRFEQVFLSAVNSKYEKGKTSA